jgi:hypothetical protein
MKNTLNDVDLSHKWWDAVAETEGVFYFKHDVRTTVQELITKLGTPGYDENEGDPKESNFEWSLCTDSGIPFLVCDKGYDRPLTNTEYVDFQILARNEEESRICKEALIHFISYGTEQ